MFVILLLALSATCFAGDYYSCERPECDLKHEPKKNIFRAMTGYNILKGNPLPDSKNKKKDPGFENMKHIFIPTVRNGENKYALDDGLEVRNVKTCMKAPKSEIITNVKDYQRFLKEVTSQGSGLAKNLEYDVSVSVPAEGAEDGVKTSIPPLGAGAFGSNSEFISNVRLLKQPPYRGILVNARADCTIYTVKVSQKTPPKFHPGFIRMLLELQEATDGDDKEKDATLKRLIENFGTHYLRNVDMGARIAITKRYNRRETMKTTEEDMRYCTEESLNLFFKLIKESSSRCKTEIEKNGLSWTTNFIRQDNTSFGSEPKKDLISWANQKFDSVIPIRMTLDPIVNLFKGDFMDKITDCNNGLDFKVDYESILKWMLPKYLKYCEDHKRELRMPSCDIQNVEARGCGLNDDCTFDQECKDDKSKPEGYYCHYPERQYYIEVKTSNIKHAGTDADVYITLFDVKDRSTDESRIDDARDNFNKDSTDVFSIKSKKPMGVLRKIRIRHDNSESGPGWHLKWVKVKDLVTHRLYTFTCNRWLAKDQLDGKIDIQCNEDSYRGRNYN